ncbi:hypothetical protein HZB88_00810 [archaeon]|nr:hypothetical protein [archaeon]
MQQYIFIHGKDPHISKLEIKAYLDARKIKYSIIGQSETSTTIECRQSEMQNLSIGHLGSITKIGVVISIEEINSIIQNRIKKNKLLFAISSHAENRQMKKQVRKEVRAVLERERIKPIEKKPRNHKFLEPQEALNLIKKGMELLLTENRVALTTAVYNTKEQEKRDVQRPVRKYPLSISIRLAKILINLSQAVPNSTLLDPFCGIGTILQEALLLNINAIGSDISKENIGYAEKNLKRLGHAYSLSSANYKLYNANASSLSHFIKEKIDYIASEPCLGPFLTKPPSEKEALKIKEELIQIYKKAFEQFAMLKPKQIAIIMPLFKTKEGCMIKMNMHEVSSRFAFLHPPILYQTGGNNIILREIWVCSPLAQGN